MITTVKRGLIAALIFIVDLKSLIQDTGQQIDFDVLGPQYKRGASKIRITEAISVAETDITVVALNSALPRGTIINFGVQGEIELAANAVLGATSITIVPSPEAIADASDGYAQPVGYGNAGFLVPAGTILARNPTTKRMFPRAIAAAGETAECVLLTDARSDSFTDSLTGYGVTYGGVIYENLLPDAVVSTGLISGTYKTELGPRFVWKVSRDNRSA